MSNAIDTPVVWTNDDICFGRSDQLEKQLAFLERHEIPGVFFLIPRCGGNLDDDPRLMRIVETARTRGHEFFQHGYLHTAFECGIPELRMLELGRAAFDEFDEHRERIEDSHQLERMVEMLEKGQKIWRRAFAESSPGFRPGWGAYCNNLYKALSILGYDWVSSRIPCMTSWVYAAGHWGEKLHFREAIPTSPHRLTQGLLELPMAGDYAFKIPNDPEKISTMVQLGLDEFDEFSRRKDPMLIVSHYHGLEFAAPECAGNDPCPAGTGYQIHDALIPALKKQGARFMNVSQLIESHMGAHCPLD